MARSDQRGSLAGVAPPGSLNASQALSGRKTNPGGGKPPGFSCVTIGLMPFRKAREPEPSAQEEPLAEWARQPPASPADPEAPDRGVKVGRAKLVKVGRARGADPR